MHIKCFKLYLSRNIIWKKQVNGRTLKYSDERVGRNMCLNFKYFCTTFSPQQIVVYRCSHLWTVVQVDSVSQYVCIFLYQILIFPLLQCQTFCTDSIILKLFVSSFHKNFTTLHLFLVCYHTSTIYINFHNSLQ